MHPVQNGICPRGEVGTALTNPSKEIEKFFPIFIH
jgi:hypothetical protein